MTDEAYPDQPNGGRGLARFLQDWTELWREELQAQANDPERVPLAMLAGVAGGGISSDMAAALEMWRTAMVAFAEAVGAETTGAEILGAKILGAEGHRARAFGNEALLDEASGADLLRTAPLGASPASMARSRDPTAPPRSKAGAAAPDARDAEIERLARRVDELQARLAKLEASRRRPG